MPPPHADRVTTQATSAHAAACLEAEGIAHPAPAQPMPRAPGTIKPQPRNKPRAHRLRAHKPRAHHRARITPAPRSTLVAGQLGRLTGDLALPVVVARSPRLLVLADRAL